MEKTNAHLKKPLVRDLITASLITDEAARLASLRAAAGRRSILLEDVIMGTLGRMEDSYGCCHWFSYALSNGGFFMTPNPHKNIKIELLRPLELHVSSETAGIIATASAYSHLALAADGAVFSDAYQRLSDFIFQHADAHIIRAALH